MQEQETAKEVNAQERSDFLGSIMRGDGWIWGIYIVLVCTSIVEMFSATSQLTYRTASFSDPAFNHIRNLILGFFVLLVCQSMHLKALRSWDKLILFAGLLFFGLSFFIGISQKGATRSVGLFQPVEFLKLGGIMVLCWAITAKDSIYHVIPWFRTKTKGRRFWAYIFIILLAAGPISTQNLSSGLIIGMASIGVMFLGKVDGKYLWLTVLAVGGLAILFLGGLKIVYEKNKNYADIETVEGSGSSKEKSGFSIDNVVQRASTWANRIYNHSDKPLWEEDTSGKKSQEIYSHMALANGSNAPWGQFFGNSKMRDFLPEAFSDYIFAIIFEEMGPVGALVVLLAYLALFIRCYILSRRTQSEYVRLLILGLSLIIVIQALLHIGVNTGAMFVTGQPLPLLSRGGTSIFCTSASFGMMLALSRIIQQEVIERQQLEAEGPIDEQAEDESIEEMSLQDGLNEIEQQQS